MSKTKTLESVEAAQAKKAAKKAVNAQTAPVVEGTEKVEVPGVATATVTKQLGRPANPESARQKRINDLAARRAAGDLKLGRPVDPTSPRQIELAKKAADKAAGIGGKKGRPSFASKGAITKAEAEKLAKAEVKAIVPAVADAPVADEAAASTEA